MSAFGRNRWKSFGTLVQALAWALVFLGLGFAYALSTPLKPFRYLGF